jgi:hypothetical protein
MLVAEYDKVSSHALAICRKSSQNASSTLAPVLRPATIERFMIEEFMAIPRQHLATNRESNIVISFAKITARKSSPIN